MKKRTDIGQTGQITFMPPTPLNKAGWTGYLRGFEADDTLARKLTICRAVDAFIFKNSAECAHLAAQMRLNDPPDFFNERFGSFAMHLWSDPASAFELDEVKEALGLNLGLVLRFETVVCAAVKARPAAEDLVLQALRTNQEIIFPFPHKGTSENPE